MLTMKIENLQGDKTLTLTGETKQEILVKLATEADFFVVGETYRRIRFDVVSGS